MSWAPLLVVSQIHPPRLHVWFPLWGCGWGNLNTGLFQWDCAKRLMIKASFTRLQCNSPTVLPRDHTVWLHHPSQWPWRPGVSCLLPGLSRLQPGRFGRAVLFCILAFFLNKDCVCLSVCAICRGPPTITCDFGLSTLRKMGRRWCIPCSSTALFRVSGAPEK